MNKSTGNEKQIAKTRGREEKYLLRIAVSFLLSAACVALEIACIYNFRYGVVARNATLFVALCSSVTVAAFIASSFFAVFGKEIAYRALAGIYLLAIFLGVVLLVMQKTQLLYVLGDETLFREYLKRAGAAMPLLFIAFQFLQVIVLPVPAFVSTAAGVALFGATKAAFCSFVGIISGSIVAFFIGRKIGYKAVAWIVGEENLKKWLQKVKGKDNFVLTAMFVLPLFPDDILCFVAGLSSMTWQYFLIMIVAARCVGIAATCYSVDLIPFNTPWGIAVWIVLAVAVVAAFFALYKNLDALNDFFKGKFAVRGKKKGDKRK